MASLDAATPCLLVLLVRLAQAVMPVTQEARRGRGETGNTTALDE